MTSEKRKSDNELLDDYRRGDTEAFDELVIRYKKPLFGFLNSHVYSHGYYDRKADLEELSQEIWLEAFQKVNLPPKEGGYSTQYAFYTYLVSCIAKYKVMQFNSQQKKKYGRMADVDEQFVDSLPDQDTPDALYARSEEMRYVEKSYGELLRLFFLCGGYPHQQLAFGFTKLIRAFKGKIMLFYGRFSAKPLAELLDAFRAAYAADSHFEGKMLEEMLGYLKPAELRLELTIRELMRADSASLSHHGDIAEKTVRSTTVEEYCVKRGVEIGDNEISDTISNWSYKLKKRLQRILHADSGEFQAGEELEPDGETCSRCYLRALPPCRMESPHLK